MRKKRPQRPAPQPSRRQAPGPAPPAPQRLLRAVRGSSKYAYLVVFFALLAGFFHPLITGMPLDSLVSGILILFLGLAGGILLYRAATGESRNVVLFGAGLGLIAASLYGVFLAA